MRTFRFVFTLIGMLALTSGPLVAAPVFGALHPRVETLRQGVDTSLGAWLLELGAGLALFGITIRKDTATLAGKFVTRASAAAGDYKDGVAGAGAEWEQKTRDGEANFEQGIQQAIADKRFGKGVAGSANKYQTNASTLGSSRYTGGIANAREAWQRGVQPALDVLKSLQLPPKGPRRSPQNMQRANAVAVALGALKTGR